MNCDLCGSPWPSVWGSVVPYSCPCLSGPTTTTTNIEVPAQPTDPIRARLDWADGWTDFVGPVGELVSALRAVLDLHWVTGFGNCHECGRHCRVRRVVAEHLGVTDV